MKPEGGRMLVGGGGEPEAAAVRASLSWTSWGRGIGEVEKGAMLNFGL